MSFFKNVFTKKKHKDDEIVIKEIPKSVQKTLPYVRAYEDGILEVKKGHYSVTMSFSDINYQIARQENQESIFLDYCAMLNYLDSSIDTQINIINRSINRDELEESILIKKNSDRYDNYRDEYNDMLKKQITAGRNDINKEKYITFTVQAPTKNDATSLIARLSNEAKTNFKKMGSNARELSLNERLKIFHDFYRGSNSTFYYEPKEHKKMGLLTKDMIAPDSFEFNRDHMLIGDRYARAVFISDIATYINDKIIADLTEFSFSMVLSINIKSIEPHTALKLIKKQITGMEANKIDYQKRSLKNGYLEAFIPHELKDRLREAEDLLHEVTNNNQKLFLVSFLIVHQADSLDQLDKDTKMIDSTAKKHLCQIRKLNYQQEDALASALPFGNNRLQLKRTLTTESTAVFMPFTSQELLQPGGMYYGLNAVSRNLILFDRKTLKNANGFILGTPGSGKSFAAKREMVNVLLNTPDEILIIDPEREYTRLVENFGGEVIKISAGSRHYINPLDMSEDYADDEDPMILKSDFVLSLCEVILGGRTGLNAREKSIIDRSMKKVYQEYLKEFDKEKIPTLKDFHKVIKEQNEIEAQDIATALELYALGNQSVFANKTNIDIQNRLVCFDIKDLGKQLKTMGMLIVLDAIWNRITTNREKGVRTWIYMDEIYLLFSNEYSAQFLFELYKRARKWGGIPTGITQNIEDLLKSDLARSMLSNSEFLLLLNQAGPDRKELAKLLNISDTQLGYVTNSSEGQGLLFSGTGIIPFVDQFPSGTKLYKMMTTKVDEI